MNILKNLFLFNKKTENNKILNCELVDNYREIAKLVKEARIQQNLTIQDLSRISKIPELTINYIENNNQKLIPKYPFIRSILIKLEECLFLKKNNLYFYQDKSIKIKLNAKNVHSEGMFSNIAHAIKIALDLNISKKIIEKTIPNLAFPGRYDYLKKGKIKKMLHKNEMIMIDGAHAPTDALNLYKYLH